MTIECKDYKLWPVFGCTLKGRANKLEVRLWLPEREREPHGITRSEQQKTPKPHKTAPPTLSKLLVLLLAFCPFVVVVVVVLHFAGCHHHQKRKKGTRSFVFFVSFECFWVFLATNEEEKLLLP
jgi:hypothetical protein